MRSAPLIFGTKLLLESLRGSGVNCLLDASVLPSVLDSWSAGKLVITLWGNCFHLHQHREGFEREAVQAPPDNQRRNNHERPARRAHSIWPALVVVVRNGIAGCKRILRCRRCVESNGRNKSAMDARASS